MQSPGGSVEAVKKGPVVEPGTDFDDETPVQEHGESVDAEEDAVDANTQLIVDEKDESKGALKSWGGVEGGEERKGEEQGVSIEPSGAGGPAVVDGHMEAVSSSPVEPSSAKSGNGDSAGQQLYESEEGRAFVSDKEVPEEIPGPIETRTKGNGWMQQHDEQEGEGQNVFGGHARLQAGVGGGEETVGSGAGASSMGEVEATKGFEGGGAVLSKKAAYEAGPWGDQDTIPPTPGKDKSNGDDVVGGDGDPPASSLSGVREEHVDEAETEEIAGKGCDAAEAEGTASGVESIAPEECQSMGGNAERLTENGKEEFDAPRGAMSEAIDPLAESVGLTENAVGEKEAAGEEDITFLQVRCTPYTYIYCIVY